MATVFELLGIKPTNNFTELKRAYLKKAIEIHPDKFATEDERVQKAKTVEFQNLTNAFSFVDDPQKLDHYFKTYMTHQGFSALAPQTNLQPEDVLFSEYSSSSQDRATVFIPVTIRVESEGYLAGRDEGFYVKKQRNLTTKRAYEQFQRDFRFDELATTLTKMSNKSPMQVGLSFNEALNVVSQHAHYDYKIIVGVLLPIGRLSVNPVSEKEYMNPNIANASSQEHFLLKHGTVFQKENIISATPMNSYNNSWRISKETTSPKKFWPQDIYSSEYNTMFNSQATNSITLEQQEETTINVANTLSEQVLSSDTVRQCDGMTVEAALSFLNKKLEEKQLPLIPYIFKLRTAPISFNQYAPIINCYNVIDHYSIALPSAYLSNVYKHLIETLFDLSELCIEGDDEAIIIMGNNNSNIDKDKNYLVDFDNVEKSLMEFADRYAKHQDTVAGLEQFCDVLSNERVRCYIGDKNFRYNLTNKDDPINFVSADREAMGNIESILKQSNIKFYRFGLAGDLKHGYLGIRQHLSEDDKDTLKQKIANCHTTSEARSISFFATSSVPPKKTDEGVVSLGNTLS